MTISPRLPKLIFFLPLLLFVGVMDAVIGKTAASPQADYLTAVQITDHSLTSEDTQYVGSFGGSLTPVVGQNSLHVIWREQNLANTGADLFYRRLPNGNTQRLSDSAAANNAGVYYQTLRISASDTPHVIWEEYSTGVDTRDINYWNPNDGLIQLVSQTPTTGYATFRPVIWLDGNNYHIVWEQRNEAQTDDVFMYWNSVSKTAVELPGFEAGLVHNGVLHITWVAGTTGPVHYWNSDNQNIVTLPNSTSSGETAVDQKGIFVDEANEVKIFFGAVSIGDPGNPATNCLASWNSVTQNTTTHVTGNRCYSLKNIQIDSSGVFHTFGVDSTIGPPSRLPFYWNSSLPNPIYFDVSSAGTGFLVGAGDLHLAANGKAHIVWKDDNDLFYWNPGDQQVINLSEASEPNTQIASYFLFPRLDSAGNLTLIWQEQVTSGSSMAPFYWQSVEKITTNLETKLGMSNIDEQTTTRSNSGGLVYGFYGVPVVGDAGAFYWDIESDSLTRVWTGGLTNTFFRYATGSGDEIFTAWIEQATDALTINSTVKGSQILNQTAADDTDNLIYLIATDDFGNLYAVWTEMSDSSGEGLDFFAAWSTDFVEAGEESVYLPLIVK